MVRIGLAFCSAIVLSLALTGTASAQKEGANAEQFQNALGIAQSLVPDGTLIKARVEKMGTIFGFYFFKGGLIHEIEISPIGEIVKKETSDATDTKVVSADVLKLIGQQRAAKTKIPEGRLLEIAGASLKKAPFKEIVYDTIDGQLVIKIGDVILDPATGKPVVKK